MDQPPPEPEPRREPPNTQVIVALIGAAATILAALLAGYFGLANRGGQPPTPPTTAPRGNVPTVTIEGPSVAPIDQLTYFTIVSSDANRAVWSIGGFNNNETAEVSPLAPSHQLQIEPTDRSRIGDSFTLVVTVYDDEGGSATASHAFEVTGEE